MPSDLDNSHEGFIRRMDMNPKHVKARPKLKPPRREEYGPLVAKSAGSVFAQVSRNLEKDFSS